MARIKDLTNQIKTDKSGVDKIGEYDIVLVVGQEYCNCHPENCCHFGGLREIRYEKKIYKISNNE